MSSPPVLNAEAFLLVPVFSLIVLALDGKKKQSKFPTAGRIAAFGILSLIGLVFYLIFPAERGSAAILAPLGGTLAVYLAAFCFFAMRSDHPGEVSIVFRIAPFVGSFGILLIGIGAMLKPEVGVSLLSMGLVLGVLGNWFFADSGFRGSRSFFAGVIGSFAGPAIILQQRELAGWILLAAFCSFPLFFLLREARRKVKKAEELRYFERKGAMKRPVMVGEGQNIEEQVVVVKPKKKKSRKGRSRTRLRSAERPVVISRDAVVEEEEVPFFGEGVLATEPGRKGNVQIDPWTGAAVQSEEEAPDQEISEFAMMESDDEEESPRQG